ncbi:hypothetical protein Halha_2156 [Halobacteroides halobius DSM 5150]|uniref:DUF4007 domain-containing protein n=1 Tax=Halobacteroides halobius (strain ATCC 35273 / DSM 5150 / MD-1) TaxID=748449 RepID=L0KCD5_HALHC|nr:DUF4007 family protein [Halobacteroides halobius]AGB42039.1 hypothetical protein Halha_2156 [Halobacteroides halobius DSM 5150]
MSYSFARHETFHIRTGWFRKGLDAIEKNNHIFLETILAMDELGIGKNMVSALRYWMKTAGLTEVDFNKRKKIQVKKKLAKEILEYDEYFEDPATFWLLHFNIATNKESATSWYWFFNQFNHLEFNEELFIERLKKYIKRTGEEPPAKTSLERDFKVFRRMYLYDPEENISPENSMESPFRELKLLVKTDEGNYRVQRPDVDNLPPRILYYCLLDSLDNEDSVNIEEVLNDEGSIGKVFKLNMTLLHEYLEHLQELDYLRLDRQAGLNSIKLKKLSKGEVLAEYYNSKLR